MKKSIKIKKKIMSYSSGSTVKFNTYRSQDPKFNPDLTGTIVFYLFLIGIPILFIYSENNFFKVSNYYQHLTTLPTVDLSSVNECPNGPFFFSSNITGGSVEDKSFGIKVDFSLILKRETEYCQWYEYSSETCGRCDDGRRCNCEQHYTYVKGWRSYQVPSLLFKNSITYYNPLRDPYPSKKFISKNIKIGENLTLGSDIIKSIKSKSRRLEWNSDSKCKEGNSDYLASFVYDKERILDSHVTLHDSMIKESFGNSDAKDEFIYVYDRSEKKHFFYSPYESSTLESLVRVFGTYLEGNIFNIQIGDLVHSCTPGDIRIHYEVISPKSISGFGEVNIFNGTSYLDVINNGTFGILKEGLYTKDGLINTYSRESIISIYFVRFIFLCWSIFILSYYTESFFNIIDRNDVCVFHTYLGILIIAVSQYFILIINNYKSPYEHFTEDYLTFIMFSICVLIAFKLFNH